MSKIDMEKDRAAGSGHAMADHEIYQKMNRTKMAKLGMEML
jgi:hypothetical protein